MQAPKRPLSPFIFFSQETRRRLKQENPSLHSRDIMKMVQKAWRALSETEKAAYKSQSKENRDEYDREKRDFDHLKQSQPAPVDTIIQGVRARRAAKEQLKLQQPIEFPIYPHAADAYPRRPVPKTVRGRGRPKKVVPTPK